MNIYQDIPSPAQGIAAQNASMYGLQNHGLTNLHRVYWNLTSGPLYEEAVFRGEGGIAHLGPFLVNTGKHTARAAADKFIVREQTTEDKVWWGQYNRPFSAGEVQRAPDAHAGLPAEPRRLRAGPVRGRRQRGPPSHPRHHREGLAQPFRAHHVLQAANARRT